MRRPAPRRTQVLQRLPQTRAAPAISIGSGVDPESWAEYGGWYSQDYGIFYRPQAIRTNSSIPGSF